MELDPSIGSIFWVGEMRQSQVNALEVQWHCGFWASLP